MSSIKLALALTLGCTVLQAQQHLTVPRADGRTTPLLVYSASPQPATGCAPLAVLSHGAGGSENGLRYLAVSLANGGYTAVVMGHAESGFKVVSESLAEQSTRRGALRGVVEDPAAEAARLADVTAALAWSDKTCRAPFRVLRGHSMGAETVMLEAGATPSIAIPAGVAGRSRFDAYVALSPEGPGVVFPEHAWANIRKPILFMTGTMDGALNGVYKTRLVPFTDVPGLPSHCQWQGVVDGGTHMNFGGRGPGAEHVDALVTVTVQQFLQGVHANACRLPAAVAGFDLKAK